MRTWKRPPVIAVLFAVAVVALAGCTQREAPGFDPNVSGANFSEAISPYTLAFIARSYDSESDQTTFTYQLQNTNAPEPGPASGVLGVFTNVFVEVPSCAGDPVSFSPPDGGTLGTNVNGIYGVDWGVSYDENPDYYYSLTFAGDIPAGSVRGIVARGGQRFLQSLVGPCEGDFSIAGIVFVDVDGDGVQDSNELGVDNVTVVLSNGDDTETVKTDSDGSYLFTTGAGNYTVAIDSVTADNTDFNEVLYDGWNPTSPTYLSVTVGPASSGNSFAFEPDVEHVIDQIDDDVYPTNGKTYQWWRIQLLHALLLPWHHSSYFYTPEQLTGFIHDIEGFALPDQYDFTPGHELLEAFRILNNHACSFDNDDDDVTMFGEEGRVLMNDTGLETDGSEDEGHHGRLDPVCDAWKVLQRELLTNEFNHVTGRGLYTNLPLQYNLIQWGEGVLQGNAPSDDFKIGGPQRSIQSPVEAGGQIFKKANGATGGGGTGG